MRDPARIDRIVELLRETWKASPDMRLGQLLVNTCGSDHLVWFTEDDTWEELLGRVARFGLEKVALAADHAAASGSGAEYSEEDSGQGG